LKKSIYPDTRQDEAVLPITAHYVEQVQSGQRPSLSDYLVRYPDHRDAIVDFVAYYHALEEHIPHWQEGSLPYEALSATSLLALECIWPRVSLSGARWPCQVQTLLAQRDSQRLSPSYLATELDLSVDVVMQLEQCRIDPLSIPLLLFRRLAQVLQQPLYSLQTYFVGGNQYQTPATSRTATQKVAEKQETYAVPGGESVPCFSFREVLMGSKQMSERQKALWYAIIEQNREP
jgi:hypothetical protein